MFKLWCERGISKYTSKYSCGGGGKCRQTDSIGSNGDGLLWQEYIGCAACQFARDLANIQQSRVVQGLLNVSKWTPSNPMETGCCDVLPVSLRDT